MKILQQALDLARHGKCDDAIMPVTKDEVKELGKKQLEILHEIMVGPQVTLALAALQNAGFFDWLIPEIREGLELKSDKQFKAIWPHTLRVVSQTPPKLSLRWAALFHDLGKAQAFNIRKGKVTFHHHEHISAKIFEKFAKRAKIFGTGLKSCVRFLVANLGRAEGYDKDWTESAIRRFARDMDIYLDDLLALSEADITTGNQKKRERIVRGIHELRKRITEVQDKDAKNKSVLPKGLGNVISQELGIPIGPQLGEIRKNLEQKIQSGELFAHEDFKYYIDYLKDVLVKERDYDVDSNA